MKNKDIILDSLRRNSGNKAAAACELGIERSTLYRKIMEYGIEYSGGKEE